MENIYKLKKENYSKVAPLIESQNELSVISTINGIVSGEIYVNDTDNPTATFIKTCECNYIAGKTNDKEFNLAISEKLDFWDQITPDSISWNEVIPSIHKDKFIRKYTRRHYVLHEHMQKEINEKLPDGYYIEEINPTSLKNMKYENVDDLLEWLDNWENDDKFIQYGIGYYIRNDKTIVSWSLSDCSYDKKIAIGINTDRRYRKQGFAKVVISKVVQECFLKGYNQIDWLCVDSNKGSIAIAEKIGFILSNKYNSFTPYPPIENVTDLSEDEWNQWAEYLDNASKSEPDLLIDCLISHIKANNIKSASDIVSSMRKLDLPIEINMSQFISYLHSLERASNFKENWINSI